MDTTFLDKDEEWELRQDDDGFVYQILKGSTIVTEVNSKNPEAKETNSKEIRRKSLLRLKYRYQSEIRQLRTLSHTFEQLQKHAVREADRGLEIPATVDNLSSSSSGKETNEPFEAEINQILMKLDVEEQFIVKLSNLCDLAESILNSNEEQKAESVMELPIWSSPQQLMAYLDDC